VYFLLRFDGGGGGGYSSGFDMAIGLARHQLTGSPTLLEKFARHVDAKTYGDIYGNWWPGTIEKLERNILSAMTDARYLQVNLDGLIDNIGEFPNLLEKGMRGIEPVEVVRGVERGNITNWEVWKIYISFKEKAFFYLNGRLASVSEESKNDGK